MSKNTDPIQSFEAAVPPPLQEDILQRIEECAWGFREDPEIEILDVEKRNVLNIEYTGVIMIGGEEHRFHIRSGDSAGTEILSWNSDSQIDREARRITTLVPLAHRVDEAIYRGQAAAFLAEWDAALDPASEKGRVLHRLPQAAAYDAYFAPGSGASRTHHDKARQAGYEIEEQEVATARRRQLLAAALPLVPLRQEGDALPQILAWDAALSGRTAAGHRALMLWAQILGAIAERGASAPRPDEASWLRETGFEFGTPGSALRLRAGLTRELITVEDIAGFDPATLPENPFAVLLNRLDPALAPDVRVNPQAEMRQILESMAFDMARKKTLEVPEVFAARAAELGYRLGCRRSFKISDEESAPSF